MKKETKDAMTKLKGHLLETIESAIVDVDFLIEGEMIEYDVRGHDFETELDKLTKDPMERLLSMVEKMMISPASFSMSGPVRPFRMGGTNYEDLNEVRKSLENIYTSLKFRK